MQTEAQREAESSIYAWAEKANVKVAHVRYHLLRNGLILKDIEISRDTDLISIDHMLIRANPVLLTGASPQIGSMKISGMRAELHYNPQSDLWQGDEMLKRIWQALSLLRIENGSLSLYTGSGEVPLMIGSIFLKQELQGGSHVVSLTSKFNGAPVELQWLRSGTAAVKSRGRLQWRGVDAALLSKSLAVGAAVGLLDGSLQWESGVGPEGSETVSLSGKLQAREKAKGGSAQTAGLEWKGGQVGSLWDVTINSKAWPLDTWGRSLPGFEGRYLQKASFDGLLQLKGRSHELLLTGDSGDLHDIVYASGTGLEHENWHINRLSYQNLRLDMSGDKLSTDNLALSGLSMPIQPSPSHGSAAQQLSAWEVVADKVSIEDLNFVMKLPRGSVHMSTLRGSCTLVPGRVSDIRLQSGAGEGSRTEWHAHGELLHRGGYLEGGEVYVSAEKVPLTQLRPLIPLQGSQDLPLMMDGTASLAVQARFQDEGWVLHGDSVAEGILLSHAGDRWQAERVTTKFGPVGMATGKQKVQSLQAEGWRYASPLEPLPPEEQMIDTAAHQAPQERARPWWVDDLADGGWEIDKVIWSGGAISVGQPDAYWVKDASLTITPLSIDKPSKISLQGDMGDGSLRLSGSWSPFAQPSTFFGKASLKNSTPLFLNEWMVASGMPRPIRGRLSASLHIKQGEQPDTYRGEASFRLRRPLAEHTSMPNDPMVDRTGFNTIDLLKRLEQDQGIVDLSFPVDGKWSEQPLSLQYLGTALQGALRDAAAVAKVTPVASLTSSKVETRIRLRESGVLSLNERIRLFKVVKKMRADRNLIVDLIPKWSGESLSQESVQRIAYTRELIWRYLNHRAGVSKRRIFPMAPTLDDQVGEIASIWVVLSPIK